MNNYLKLSIYTLSLLLVWGICFLDQGFSNQTSVLIGLGLTIYSLYRVKKSEAFKNTKNASLIVFIGPIIYLMAAAIFLAPLHIGFFLKSPIVIAFLLFLVTYAIRNFSMKTHGVALAFVCYLYAFSLYPTFLLEDGSFQKKNQISQTISSVKD
jgi:hypothetical protein